LKHYCNAKIRVARLRVCAMMFHLIVV
jgi:hypothetical protein